MADPFIGEIRMAGFNFAPRGWALCAGALLPIASNSTLFSLLGTMYGGDGRTTFALPDLRGRTPMSKGRHPGSLYDWRQGQKAGAETHTLTIPELAAHSHTVTITTTSGSSGTAAVTGTATGTIKGTGASADSNGPKNKYLATTPTGENAYSNSLTEKLMAAGAVTVDLTSASASITLSGGGASGVVDANGGSRAFSILQPVLAVNFILAMVGIYPPRS